MDHLSERVDLLVKATGLGYKPKVATDQSRLWGRIVLASWEPVQRACRATSLEAIKEALTHERA